MNASTASQVSGLSGSTLNTAPPNVTISTCPMAVAAAMLRNVGFENNPAKPLRFGTSDRQLIWFHT